MKCNANPHSKRDPKKALEILRRSQNLSSRHGGPTQGMTKDEIIRSIKKTREELWSTYLAPRS